jgi:hypothetical protein
MTNWLPSSKACSTSCVQSTKAGKLSTPRWSGDAQFAANHDTPAKGEAKENLDKLFSLIANITPAPIGLGPAI